MTKKQYYTCMLVTFSTFDLFKGAVVELSINLVSGPEYTTTPVDMHILQCILLQIIGATCFNSPVSTCTSICINKAIQVHRFGT